MRRVILVSILFAVTIATACPARQGTREEQTPADAVQVTVHPGQAVTLFDADLRVLVTDLQRGGTWVGVTLLLQAHGETVEREVRAVRNAEYSEAVRLSPYAVRVEGFPGVDQVDLVAWEE